MTQGQAEEVETMAGSRDFAAVWYSALQDSALLSLTAERRWWWVVFLVYTARHGAGGEAFINPQSETLRAALGIPWPVRVEDCLSGLPNVAAERMPEGTIRIRFVKWGEYQDAQVFSRISTGSPQDLNSVKTCTVKGSSDSVGSGNGFTTTGIDVDLDQGSILKGKRRRARPVEFTDDFERFWNLYPRRKGKGAAWRAWLVLTDEQRRRAVVGLQRWLVSRELRATMTEGREQHGDASCLIPHASTWLNQHRWEDDVDGVRPEWGEGELTKAKAKAEALSVKELEARASELAVHMGHTAAGVIASIGGNPSALVSYIRTAERLLAIRAREK